MKCLFKTHSIRCHMFQLDIFTRSSYILRFCMALFRIKRNTSVRFLDVIMLDNGLTIHFIYNTEWTFSWNALQIWCNHTTFSLVFRNNLVNAFDELHGEINIAEEKKQQILLYAICQRCVKHSTNFCRYKTHDSYLHEMKT